MAESNYQKQTWKKYDAEKDILTNIAQGGVATSERLNHMEDGIEKANIPYTVGNVTTGPTASVTINDDNSIDFVFPQNTGGGVVGDSGSNFTVSTASPSPENTITKSNVLNSDDVSEGDLIMCPDGAIYEVITVGADNFTVENKNVSINTGGGKSAYDIWKEQPGNEGKSEEEFLESLKGEPGDAGIQGATGQSAYELWKTQFGNENKSEQDFLDSLKGDKGDPGDVGPTGADGQSAYELWKSQEGNESKTETDFLNALKGAAGEAGEDGQSAYELWKSQPGNENKTEKEFLASLKGEKGDKGDPGQSTGEGGSDMGNYIGEAPSHPKSMSASVTNNSTSKPVIDVSFSPGATNSGCNYGGMAMLVKEGSIPESFDDAEIVAEVLEGTNKLSWTVVPKTPVEEEKRMQFGVSIAPFSTNKAYNKLMKYSQLVDVDIIPIRNVWKSYSIGSSDPETASLCDSSFYPGCLIKQPDGFYYGFNGEDKVAKMNADTFETTAIDDVTEWSFSTLKEFATTYINEHFSGKQYDISGGINGGAYYVKDNYMYILGDLLGSTSDSSPSVTILCIIKIDITDGSYEVFTSDNLNTYDSGGSNGLVYHDALPFTQGSDVLFITRYYIDDPSGDTPFEYAVFKCGSDNKIEKVEGYTVPEDIVTNGIGKILLMSENSETVKYYTTTNNKNIDILTLDKNTKNITQDIDVVTASKIASADGSIRIREGEIKYIDGIDPSGRYYFITTSVSANYYICYDSVKNSIYKIQGDINNSYGSTFMYIGCGENKLYATTYPSGSINRIELRLEEE